MDDKTKIALKFCKLIKNSDGTLNESVLKYIFELCGETIIQLFDELSEIKEDFEESWSKAANLEEKLENIIEKYNLPENIKIEK